MPRTNYPLPIEAQHKFWLWLANRFQRRRCLKNVNGRRRMPEHGYTRTIHLVYTYILLLFTWYTLHLVSLRLRWAKILMTNLKDTRVWKPVQYARVWIPSQTHTYRTSFQTRLSCPRSSNSKTLEFPSTFIKLWYACEKSNAKCSKKKGGGGGREMAEGGILSMWGYAWLLHEIWLRAYFSHTWEILVWNPWRIGTNSSRAVRNWYQFFTAWNLRSVKFTV